MTFSRYLFCGPNIRSFICFWLFLLTLSMPCCTCRVGSLSTCENCRCAKINEPCKNCSLNSSCGNPFGGPSAKAPRATFSCPFEGCHGGQHGGPVSKRAADISRLRSHVNSHCKDGFIVPTSWLAATGSRRCPDCDIFVTSEKLSCSHCRSRVEPAVVIPRADNFPRLNFNRVDQISLEATAGAMNTAYIQGLRATLAAGALYGVILLITVICLFV